MQFAGNTGSRVLLNSASAHSFIQNTGVFFVGAWIRPTQLGSQQRTILGNNATVVTENGIIFSIGATTGLLRCQLTALGSVQINISATLRVGSDRLNRWTHVGVTGNGSQLTFFMWDGGFSQNTPAGTIAALGSGDSTFPIMIGLCNGATPAAPFGGHMEEVIISSKNWTFAEYQDYVLRGERPSTGRVSFYKFDEGSGSSQTDTDGTSTGSSTSTIYNSSFRLFAPKSGNAGTRAAATARVAA